RWTANEAAEATEPTIEGDALPTFPPEGTAYNNPDTALAHIIWRFVGWFAPDVVTEIHGGDASEWQQVRQGRLVVEAAWPDDSLAVAVRREPVAGIATTLSLRAPGSAGGNDTKEAAGVSELLRAYRRGGHRAIKPEERSPL